jgi:hypothetical protein
VEKIKNVNKVLKIELNLNLLMLNNVFKKIKNLLSCLLFIKIKVKEEVINQMLVNMAKNNRNNNKLSNKIYQKRYLGYHQRRKLNNIEKNQFIVI